MSSDEGAVDRTGITLFLSHSSVDKPLVRAIASQLRVRGYGVWIDEEEILPGERILSRVEDGLRSADYLILFITPSAIRSAWVDEEWRTKFEQQMMEHRVRVIPVVLGDVQPHSPLLAARLRIQGTRKELLSTAAKEIDRGILGLTRRAEFEGRRPRHVAFPGPATVEAMRRELAEVARTGGNTEWEAVVERLLSARAIAAAAYDAGDSDRATCVYDEMLEEASNLDPLWQCPAGLEALGSSTRESVQKYLLGTQSGEIERTKPQQLSGRAWTGRMIFDAVIDYAQAVSILREFVGEIGRVGEPYARAVHNFDPLRYAVQERTDKIEPLQSRTLETVCSVGIQHARDVLAEHIGATSGAVDLHLAVLVRMCRCPSISPNDDASDEAVQRRTAVEVVEDLALLQMSLFNMGAFLHLGGIDTDEYKKLRDMGAIAVFDRALSNRGYPRDADYWTSGDLVDPTWAAEGDEDF